MKWDHKNIVTFFPSYAHSLNEIERQCCYLGGGGWKGEQSATRSQSLGINKSLEDGSNESVSLKHRRIKLNGNHILLA